MAYPVLLVQKGREKGMTDYTELVKALRLCQFGECGCGKCYYKELKGDWCTEDNHPEFFDCDDKLKLDAAAAIEALQEQVRMLDKHDTDLHNEGYDVGYYAGRRDWEPKRGKWIVREVDSPGQMHPVAFRCMCSMCLNEYVFPRIPKYCPDCGSMNTAKMEVQE